MGFRQARISWYVALALLAAACGEQKPPSIIRLPDRPPDEPPSVTARPPVVAKPATTSSRGVASSASRPIGSAEPGARYQLLTDPDVGVIRLDVVTGDVAIVNGSSVTPAVLVDEKSRRLDGATTARRAPARPTLEGALLEAEPAPQEPIVTVMDRRVTGPRVTITAISPVYLTATDGKTPLRVLAPGSIAKLLGMQGSWYQIEFEDPRWGRRFGFVATTAAAIQPADSPMFTPQ